MSPGPHVVVLAGVPGEGATHRARCRRWRRPRRASRSRPRRCSSPRGAHARSGCGDAALGAPLYTYARRRSRRGEAGSRSSSSTPRSAAPRPVLVVLDPATGHGGHELRRTRRCPRGRLMGRRWRSPGQEGCRSSTRRPARSPTFLPAILWWRPRSGARSASSSCSMSPARRTSSTSSSRDSVVLARYPVPGRDRRIERPRDLSRRFAARLPPLRTRCSGDVDRRHRRVVHAARACSTRPLQPVGFTATGTLLGINRPADRHSHPRARQCCG